MKGDERLSFGAGEQRVLDIPQFYQNQAGNLCEAADLDFYRHPLASEATMVG